MCASRTCDRDHTLQQQQNKFSQHRNRRYFDKLFLSLCVQTEGQEISQSPDIESWAAPFF